MKEFLAYVGDMKSWILLFGGALIFTDVLIWMDKGLSMEMSSLIYLNGLLVMVFVIFLVWRYKKETSYMKELIHIAAENDVHWQEALPEPVFNRDQLTNEFLGQIATDQLNNLSEIKTANLIESDYTAAWVHEVKAPLTAMKMTIDANREFPPMRKIEAEWLRVHLLIDRQLYMSRMPSLETDYVLTLTEIVRLVTAELRDLTPWCLEKNIGIELDEKELAVVTDSKWCRFIIRQLLTNAIKYSPAGGTISITTNQKPSGHRVLCISDEGPGIPAHDLPRVFDKGFTGNTGRLHNAATGLGLYLAQQVAMKIGILLTIKSEVGKGTTVHMTFPMENEFDATRK
ncbi:sensor histidine kinase [Sporosarcina sp. OR05]|uniref:sensor histidine kinase n=1 Tax=Sporosarcina sp. OR05 TaxID=2969819 RepID=UPI00352A57F7